MLRSNITNAGQEHQLPTNLGRAASSISALSELVVKATGSSNNEKKFEPNPVTGLVAQTMCTTSATGEEARREIEKTRKAAKVVFFNQTSDSPAPGEKVPTSQKEVPTTGEDDYDWLTTKWNETTGPKIQKSRTSTGTTVSRCSI